MSELIADLFISVDGCAKGSRSPAYFGFGGPDLRPLDRRSDEAAATAPHGPENLPGAGRVAGTRSRRGLVQPGGHAHHGVLPDPADGFVAAGDEDERTTSQVLVGQLKAGDTDLRTIGSLSLVSQLLGARTRRPPQAARLSADRRGDRAGAGVRPVARHRPRPGGSSPVPLTGGSCSPSTARRAVAPRIATLAQGRADHAGRYRRPSPCRRCWPRVAAARADRCCLTAWWSLPDTAPLTVLPGTGTAAVAAVLAASPSLGCATGR